MSTIPETLKNVPKSFGKRGSKNPQWAGDKVTYFPLHRWVRRNLPPPKNCQTCGLEKPLDAANISQEYRRDLTDWKYLCRRCHMIEDGRMEKVAGYSPPISDRICEICPKPHKARGYCSTHYEYYKYHNFRKKPKVA